LEETKVNGLSERGHAIGNACWRLIRHISIFLFGFCLASSGKPFHGAILKVQKLISIAAVDSRRIIPRI
jgi:hypothetical protein